MGTPKIIAELGAPQFGSTGFVGLLYSPMFIFAMGMAGTVTSVTTERIVIQEDDVTIVFKGEFTLTGDDVTGGTMTDYTVSVGTTRLLKAKDFSVDAGALFTAIEGYQTDSTPFFDLMFGDPLKYVGSKYDDFLLDVTAQTEGGAANNDVLVGKKGNDWILGGLGDDLLKGNKGNDVLIDVSGKNKMIGGPGDDIFAFGLFENELSPPVSRIKDFKVGEDLIGLFIADEGIPLGYLGKQYFHKGTKATTAEQMVIYDKSTGRLYLDRDGNGAEAQSQIAKLKPGTNLHADDFLVMTPFIA